uniref:DNA-directed RNA polymerase n=1 Tax=Globodera pallida TaxID=36090 RepID=A0A183C552_GLOPA
MRCVDTFTRLGRRDGTNVDRERMYHLLKLMRYETTIKDNLRARQMLEAITDFAKEVAHQAADRRLATDADFLICCSTTGSRVSWRSNLRGSRFIQAICECFARHSAVDDVLRLMTKVNAVVAAMNSNRKLGYLQVS